MNTCRAKTSTDILFVNPPQFTPRYLPLGLGYLCEAVKQRGYTPAVLDINNLLINSYGLYQIEKYWSGGDNGRDQTYWWRGEGFAEIWEIFKADFLDYAKQIAESEASIIGFSVNMMNTLTTEKIAAEVKRLAPQKIVIYGGHECKHYETCKDISAVPNYIFVGECEESLPDFLDIYFAKGDCSNVPGVINNQAPQKSFQPRQPPANLDALPWPKWEEFNLDHYKIAAPFLTMTIDESRGCTWAKCTFCSDFSATPGYRRRSAESLFTEIKYFVDTKGINCFHFSCLLLNGDHAELEKLCDLIIAAKLDISFSAQFRTDKHLTLPLLKKLRAAGLPNINFGVETGSAGVMKLMRKGSTVALVETCLRNAKSAGLLTNINLLVGFPGETEDHIEETIEFLRRNRELIDIIEVVNIFGVQYGSAVWAKPDHYGCNFHMPRGTREDRNWVSADGSSTYKKRVKRAQKVSDAIRSLELAAGFTSQRINFSHIHMPKFSSALYRKALLEQFNILWPEVTHTHDRVLVLRTCPQSQFVQFIMTLLNFRPNLEVEILAQNSVAEELDKLTVGSSIIQCPDGPMSLANLSEELQTEIGAKSYQNVLIPLGPMPLHTYEHVFELTKRIPGEKIVMTAEGSQITSSPV